MCFVDNSDYKNVKRSRIPIFYHSACGYMRAYFKTLSEMIKPNLLSTDEQTFSVAVVNCMIAIELFLKFIHGFSQNHEEVQVLNTHSISKIFRSINNKTKKELKDRLSSEMLSFIEKLNKSHNSDDDIFGDFVQWRYLEQDNKATYNFDFNLSVKLLEELSEYSHSLLNKKLDSQISLPNFSSTALDEESLEIINAKIESQLL